MCAYVMVNSGTYRLELSNLSLKASGPASICTWLVFTTVRKAVWL